MAEFVLEDPPQPVGVRLKTRKGDLSKTVHLRDEGRPKTLCGRVIGVGAVGSDADRVSCRQCQAGVHSHARFKREVE